MENLGKIADLVCELGNVAEDLAKKDYYAVAKLMDEVSALPGVDWKALKDEALNYDADALSARIEAKLDLENDALEDKIEKVTKVVLKVAEMGLDLYELFKPRQQAQA